MVALRRNGSPVVSRSNTKAIIVMDVDLYLYHLIQLLFLNDLQGFYYVNDSVMSWNNAETISFATIAGVSFYGMCMISSHGRG